MSSIDYSSREINIKIAYFGPGLAGKTTNLQYICTKTFSNERGEMTTIDVADAKVSRLSLLPLSLGEVEGFKVRFNLVTVPGQVFGPDSSDDAEVLLKDVDGVCFVVDSQMERMEANIESSDHLFSIFETLGYDLDTIAYVVQFNKRDLPTRSQSPSSPRSSTRRTALPSRLWRRPAWACSTPSRRWPRRSWTSSGKRA